MSVADTAEVFAELHNALVLLDEAQSDGEGVRAAVYHLGATIDACEAVLDEPVLPDAIADHNALVDEVNAAIGRYDPAVEALNAVGASCQFCGVVIEDGEAAVQTAVILAEGIGLYAHTACRDVVAAAQAGEV